MTNAKRMPPNPLKDLRRELSAMAFNPSSVLKTLPDWSEDAAESPSGLVEIRAYIAKHFGLRMGIGGRLEPRPLSPCRFKAAEGRTEGELGQARTVATAIARIVATATRAPWLGTLPGAKELRENILARPGARWVGFKALVDACWEAGIPVLYVPDLPITSPKMDGMVTLVEGRPVIIITTKRASHPAWALFVLAHEMGHIGKGHLAGGDEDAIVDGHVNESLEDGDDQEREANAYALELLTGSPNMRIRANFVMNAETLAREAYKYGEKHKINPGHVVLNFARTTKGRKVNGFALANAALKHYDSGATSDICREALVENTDTNSLPDDSVSFLESVGLL